MLEIEIVGELPAAAPPRTEIERLCSLALAGAAITDGHLAIEFVKSERIAALNAEHRAKPRPTDVLSFPIDADTPLDGQPRELGDIVICPEHTADIREALVHGVLHLAGLDHERDDGEMLTLQREILAW